LIEHFFYEVHDFIKRELVNTEFFCLFGLEYFYVLKGEKVVGGHFEGEQDHGKDEKGP
jgi:hypothetical protein